MKITLRLSYQQFFFYNLLIQFVMCATSIYYEQYFYIVYALLILLLATLLSVQIKRPQDKEIHTPQKALTIKDRLHLSYKKFFFYHLAVLLVIFLATILFDLYMTVEEIFLSQLIAVLASLQIKRLYNKETQTP